LLNSVTEGPVYGFFEIFKSLRIWIRQRLAYLAWVLGFIIPGAPGGIGIREVILAGLYAQELGQGMAVGLSVVLRVITSLGDLATFTLAYWLSTMSAKNQGLAHDR